MTQDSELRYTATQSAVVSQAICDVHDGAVAAAQPPAAPWLNGRRAVPIRPYRLSLVPISRHRRYGSSAPSPRVGAPTRPCVSANDNSGPPPFWTFTAPLLASRPTTS